MTYHFHEEAESELNQAITYYEECQPHLGLELSRYHVVRGNAYSQYLT